MCYIVIEDWKTIVSALMCRDRVTSHGYSSDDVVQDIDVAAIVTTVLCTC